MLQVCDLHLYDVCDMGSDSVVGAFVDVVMLDQGVDVKRFADCHGDTLSQLRDVDPLL